jgi:hypothetical protein
MLNRFLIALATLLATHLVSAHGTHAGNIHVEQAQAPAWEISPMALPF